MLRLPALAVSVLLVLGLLGTPAQGTTAAADVAAPAPITWSTCTDDELRFLDLQCGRIRVPRDHADPTGPTIELALTIRRHTVAASGYRGVMLVNPGGPGGSGLSLASLGDALPHDVASSYDWIGFDPRGVGLSTPALRCNRNHFGVDRPRYLPNALWVYNHWLRKSRAYADACNNTATKRALLPHLTTLDTVRDMELIRQALGAEKLGLYGFSYGSYLGQVYATRYPDRVGRFVLDGVVDPRRVWYAANVDQNRGFDRNLNYFFAYLARYPRAFHLGRDWRRIRAGYYAVQRRVDVRPAAGGRLGPSELNDAMLEAGYYVYDWVGLGLAYSALVRRNNGWELYYRYRDSQMGDDNGYAIYNAVTCTDAAWPSWYTMRAQARYVYKSAPFATWGNTWFNAPCLYWRAPRRQKLAVSGSAVTAKILLISETRDAATPYTGAVATRARFPSASLIAGVAGSTHSSSLSGVACVDDAVARYLRTGAVPTRVAGSGPDRRCGAVRPPVPTTYLGRDGQARPDDPMPAVVRRDLIAAQRTGH